MENITEIDTMSNINHPGQFIFKIDDSLSLPDSKGTNGKLI